MSRSGMSDLRTEAAKLKARIQTIMQERGIPMPDGPVEPKIPPDSLICQPDCPRCGGTGLVASNFQVGHPDFGRLLPCPNLPMKIRVRTTDQRSGLQVHEIDNLRWDLVFDNGTAMSAQLAVRQVLANGYGFVYLWGGPGQAKTLLLKIAVAEAVRAGQPAAYAAIADILDEIREAYSLDNPRESAAVRLARWSEVPLLCIDELGRTADTEWANEKLFQLLNRRHERAVWQESVTLIASNIDPEKYDAALYSRMRDSRHLIIHMEGKDARTIMRPEDRF